MRKLPQELVEKLNEHPYVKLATEWTISFTPEFKQIAYDEYSHGKSMKQVFKDAGFEVAALGQSRIQNFRNRLMSKAEDKETFEDGRKANGHKAVESTEAQMAKRIRELEHQNAYLEQENEFLKKIQDLEKAYAGKAGKQK